MPSARTLGLTLAALGCFAANSLLCRAALARGLADPGTFTAIRIASGAAALAVVLAARRARPSGGTLGSAAALVLYAAAFSLSYVRIGAGVGALLLFGAVQVTMVGWSALRGGARPGPAQLLGMGFALAGLAWLTLPGAAAPDAAGAALMIVAGAAWGAYSLRGRSAKSPLATTAHNFLLGVPLAGAFLAVFAAASPGALAVRGAGVALAVASGAASSGAGYAIWYAVVPALGLTRAAAVQLSVPVLAGLGATVFLGETLTLRVAAAGAAILAGIALTLRR